MDLLILKDFLLYAFCISYGILLVWFFMMMFARNWAYRLHKNFFGINKEQFNFANYTLMGGYKLTIFVFFLVPYIALCILTNK